MNETAPDSQQPQKDEKAIPGSKHLSVGEGIIQVKAETVYIGDRF